MHPVRNDRPRLCQDCSEPLGPETLGAVCKPCRKAEAALSSRPPVILDRDVAEDVMTALLALREERDHWADPDPDDEPEIVEHRKAWYPKFLQLIDDYHESVYKLETPEFYAQLKNLRGLHDE